MSEYWTYRCNICNTECSESNNHIESILFRILKMSDSIKQIYDLDIKDDLQIEVMFYGREYIDFLISHNGHDIVISSEYGRYITKDGIMYERDGSTREFLTKE